MAQYRYTAKNADGQKKTGVMSATDKAELQSKLHENNEYLVAAKEIEKKRAVKQMKPKALSEFCRELGTLLEAGVTLVRAITIIANGEAIKPKERALYQELLKELRQGVALSDAMEGMQGVFPPLMIYMFRSGENSGNLDTVALQLATHFEKSHKLNTKISSSMSYPKILIVMVIGVVFIMLKFILPKFNDLFSAMGELPLSTRILLGLGNVVEKHWAAIIVIAVAGFFFIRFLFMIPQIRLVWHKALVKMPIVGPLNKTICTSRFSRTISSLYSAGIPIVSALQIARKTIGNDYIDNQFDEVVPFVRAGNTLSEGIDKVDGFVRKLSDSIRVGEETGKLDNMLSSTADAMEYDADVAISKLVGLVEPGMMILMGLLVAFVLVSVFSALMGSYSALSTI